MARLTRRSRKDSYKELLTVGDNNVGLSSTLQNIIDGSGVSSLVQISLTGLNIDVGGTLTLGGVSVVTGSVIVSIAEEGSVLNTRPTVNFVGAGITASDDSGNSRTNVTLDSTLNSIAALGTAADKLAYTTDIDTWAETSLTSFARSILDDTSASEVRTTIGVAIGSAVQAWDSQLDALAGSNLTFSDSILTTVSDAILIITPGGGNSLDVVTTDTRTATVNNAVRVLARTSGTAAANIGTGFILFAPNASGTDISIANFIGRMSTVTAGSEQSFVDIALRNAGALVTHTRFSTTGASRLNFNIGNSAVRTLTYPDNNVDLSNVTQATMETATATGQFVTPAAVKWNPGVAKQWALFDGSGTPALTASLNTASITDNGIGSWKLNNTINFSSANYVACITPSGAGYSASKASSATTGVEVRVYDAADAAVDDTAVNVVCFGDQ